MHKLVTNLVDSPKQSITDIEECSQALIILIKKIFVGSQGGSYQIDVVLKSFAFKQHVPENVEQHDCIFT
jgi:hypothetical protein